MKIKPFHCPKCECKIDPRDGTAKVFYLTLAVPYEIERDAVIENEEGEKITSKMPFMESQERKIKFSVCGKCIVELEKSKKMRDELFVVYKQFASDSVKMAELIEKELENAMVV